MRRRAVGWLVLVGAVVACERHRGTLASDDGSKVLTVVARDGPATTRDVTTLLVRRSHENSNADQVVAYTFGIYSLEELKPAWSADGKSITIHPATCEYFENEDNTVDVFVHCERP